MSHLHILFCSPMIHFPSPICSQNRTDSSLSKNHVKGATGGVTPDTYIAFLIIECMALPFALLISPLENVVRSDGTRIVMAEKLSTKQEIKKIKFTMTSKLILLSALWAVWSFFYSGSWVRFILYDPFEGISDDSRAHTSEHTLPYDLELYHHSFLPSSACMCHPCFFFIGY